MSKIEKDIKKCLTKEFTDVNPSPSLRNRVFNNLGINSEKKKNGFFFTRRSASLIATFACLAIFIVIGQVFILSPQQTEDPKYQAIVQVDVNPSIEMTIDEKGNVTSVRGLNDEGKMIIVDEELTSKNIKDVLNIIISEEIETGYFNIESNENKITFSVCCENETNTEKVKTELLNNLESIKSDKKLDLTVNYTSSKTKENITEFLSQLYPYIDFDNFSFDELIEQVAKYNNEVISLASTRLEELYINFKNDYFETKKEAFIDQLVNELDNTYQEIVSKYDKIYDSFVKAYEDVENSFFENYVSEDSSYQQALKELEEKKIEYLKQKKVVEKAKNGSLITYQYELGKLVTIKSDYLLSKTSLEIQEDIANEAYQNMLDLLNDIIIRLSEVKNDLPDSIKEVTYNNVFSSFEGLDESINSSFNSKYSSYIENIKNNVLQNKNILKES